MPGRRRGPARRGPARPPARRRVRRNVRTTKRRRRRRRMLVGGAVVVGAGALAYKLSKKDSQQIEQYSGVPVEEMTDEELEAAVQELNLRKEPLDDSDQAYLETQADAPAAEPDYLEQLERLGKLKEQGIITDEEFAAKKAEILGL